jgi:hypothetical protein
LGCDERTETLFEFQGNAEAMRYTHADTSLRECRRRIAIHGVAAVMHLAHWTARQNQS